NPAPLPRRDPADRKPLRGAAPPAPVSRRYVGCPAGRTASRRLRRDRRSDPVAVALPHVRARRSVSARRVLITGAARGIGAATARRLADDGARVALVGLEPELLERVAAECGGAPWWECDVSDRARVAHVANAAADALGGIDVVVANAGVAGQVAIVSGG